MKFAIPVFALAIVFGVGCQQQNKPATAPAGMDLAPAPAPAAYTPPPPVQTATPDPALAAATPAASNAPAPSSNTYTIKKGDTLWKIAATHYGDGKKWKQICDANPGLSPNQLRVGQSIALP